MFQFLEYYGRFDRFRTGVRSLPAWARGALLLAALPGILLGALSLLALLVSILALLLLTVPVYRLVAAVTGSSAPRPTPTAPPMPGETVVIDPAGYTASSTDAEPPRPSPGRRHIDVKIVE